MQEASGTEIEHLSHLEGFRDDFLENVAPKMSPYGSE